MNHRNPRLSHFIGGGILLALFIHLASMFWPYLAGTFRLSNDYLGIPGETQINGRYVRNPEFAGAILRYEILFAGGRISEGAGEPNSAPGRAGDSAQELEFQIFLERNRQEIEFQTQCGWIMHHHNSMLAPVNEYLLGKPVTDINHQYGWLNTLLLGHLMQWTGGATLQNYFRILYSFYPIYYLLFLGAAFLLTRSLGYVLLAALISFANLQWLDFLQILLAPGFNPLRQIFYLPVVLFFFYYLQKGGLKYLIFASLFALISILSNKEFGLFVAVALVACLVLRGVHEGKRGWPEIAIITATAILAAGLFFFAKIGKNPMGQYYLLGISGPPMEKSILAAALLIMSLVYAFLLKILQFRDNRKYVVAFLFFYSKGVFLYYVWNSAPNHFFSVASPMMLGAVLLLKLSLEAAVPERLAKPVIGLLLLVTFLGFYLPSGLSYYAEREKYERIFENRRVFGWTLPTARISTTMDPAYVDGAVQIVQQHSSRERPIYIISKYDNLVPFLAERFSAMPFSEVATSLLTPKEVALCIGVILEQKPEIIFVDTELVENPSDSGIDPAHPMYLLASQHFELRPKLAMLRELTRVYLGVRDQYEVIKKGPLLSVCRRIQR